MKRRLLMICCFLLLLTGIALAEDGRLILPAHTTVIEEEAFYGDESLTRVDLPADITEIGARAFSKCGDPDAEVRLYIVPDGVTAEADSFEGCRARIYLNGEELPWRSPYLTYQVTDEGVMITGLTDSSITDLVIPERLEGKPVVALGNNAFSGNSTLESVVLPDTLTEIGNFAFQNCKKLSSVRLPDSLVSIGISALRACDALVDIRLPEGLKAIGNEAFRSSGISAQGIPLVWLPAGLESFGTDVFRDSGVAPVVIRESEVAACAVRDHYMFAYADSPDFVYRNWYYPGRNGYVTGLHAYAGSQAPIRLPDDVVGVRADGFRNLVDAGLVCAQLSDTAAALDQAELNYTFPGHEDLRYRKIDDVLYIMGYAGDGNEIVIPKAEAYISAGVDEQIQRGAFQGQETVIRVVIPEGVTRIEDSAFMNCYLLSEIVFPDSLRSINQCAFRYCGRDVADLRFDLPDHMTDMTGRGGGNHAFIDCNAVLVCGKTSDTAALLTDRNYVYAGRGERDFRYRYESCTDGDVTGRRLWLVGYEGSDQTVEIPSGIYGIRRYSSNTTDAAWRTFHGYAFCGNGTVKQVVIPEGTVIIEDSAFMDCVMLSSVSLPESLEIIKNHAFERTGTTSGRFVVSLPAGLKEMTTGSGAGWDSFNESTAVLVAPQGSWVASQLYEDWWQFYGSREAAEAGDWRSVIKKPNETPGFEWKGNI